MVSGAKMRIRTAQAKNADPICDVVTVPCMSPRTAVTVKVTGLMTINFCINSGIVDKSTKTLLINNSGKETRELTIETA